MAQMLILTNAQRQKRTMLIMKPTGLSNVSNVIIPHHAFATICQCRKAIAITYITHSKLTSETVRSNNLLFSACVILDGDLGAKGTVRDAYMKQKHRMIWERRHGPVGSGIEKQH